VGTTPARRQGPEQPEGQTGSLHGGRRVSRRLPDAAPTASVLRIHHFTLRHALGVKCGRLCRRPHGQPQRSASHHPRSPWSPDTLIRNGTPMGDLATCGFFSSLSLSPFLQTRQLATIDQGPLLVQHGSGKSQPVGSGRQCARLRTTAMTCTHERDRTSVGTRRPRPSLFSSLFTVSPSARSQGGRSVTMRRAWFLQLTARIFFILFFFEIRGDGTASHMRRWHGRSRAAESWRPQRHRPLVRFLQWCGVPSPA